MKYASLILCFLSISCSSLTSVSVCPKISSYSNIEQLNQAAAEDMLPVSSALNDPLLEWARLRNELRACNGEK